MKKILDSIKNSLVEEIKKEGYICDSDNTDRIVDSLIKENINKISKNEEELEDNLVEYFDEILNETYKFLNEKYNKVSKYNLQGEFIRYFYDKKYSFNSINELEKYFKIGE